MTASLGWRAAPSPGTSPMEHRAPVETSGPGTATGGKSLLRQASSQMEVQAKTAREESTNPDTTSLTTRRVHSQRATTAFPMSTPISDPSLTMVVLRRAEAPASDSPAIGQIPYGTESSHGETFPFARASINVESPARRAPSAPLGPMSTATLLCRASPPTQRRRPTILM